MYGLLYLLGFPLGLFARGLVVRLPYLLISQRTYTFVIFDSTLYYRGATVFPDNVQLGPEPEVVELGLNAIVKLIILGHTFYLMKPPSA